jgi:hypothetical protein
MSSTVVTPLRVRRRKRKASLVRRATPLVLATWRVIRRAIPVAILVALAISLLAVVALRFAQPIEDGDIFWHMAYGQQMIERGTLHTDHSLYSWMPASNAAIYCAWVSELLFLGVWKVFGLAGIFGLRYAAILAVLAMLAIHGRRCGMLARVETWLAMLVTLLASVAATIPKPEMLSLVLWHLLLFCYFGMLLAVENRRNALAWIYAIPAIMLVWVNAHGGFILAAPFFVVTGVAAWIAAPKREARHIGIAWGLCALATVTTPYGVRYPIELVNYALGRMPRPDTAWNNAFQPTFSAAGSYHHLPELLVWMTLGMLLTAVLAWRAQARRHVLIVGALYVVYVPLDLLYLRSTFLLPAVFGYGVLFLLGAATSEHAPGRATEHENVGTNAHVAGKNACSTLVAVLFVFFGVRTIYQARVHPETDAWMGFGISYFEPVEEAEFLRQGSFGPRLYNTFNSGGYLLWQLYPRYKVMVDGRSFPYLGWFDELYKFTRTEDPKEFQAFLDRHPADVALVDFQEDLVWRSFLKAPGWRPVFYGPSAAVFARTGAAATEVRAASGLAHLRNGEAGLRPFYFAIAVGDFRTAWNLLGQMEGPLAAQVNPLELESAHLYRDGHAALRVGDYSRAYRCFEQVFRHRIISGLDNSILLLLRAELKLEASRQVDRAQAIRAGLVRLTAPE